MPERFNLGFGLDALSPKISGHIWDTNGSEDKEKTPKSR